MGCAVDMHLEGDCFNAAVSVKWIGLWIGHGTVSA
jgi:hypothetical protein